MKGTRSHLKAAVRRRVELDYLVYVPKGRRAARSRWPLVVFLHGMGERGSDPSLVTKHGPPKLAEAGRDFPFVLVAPQCPLRSLWTLELDSLAALLKEVIRLHDVDTSRIILAGLSMGGFGTWHMAVEHPRAFAAIVPVCGGAESALGFPERVKVLKDVPVWAFHGAKDATVPIRESQQLVDALLQAGNGARLTVYPKAGHDSWTRTYNNPGLYEWMLKQRNEGFRL